MKKKITTSNKANKHSQKKLKSKNKKSPIKNSTSSEPTRLPKKVLLSAPHMSGHEIKYIQKAIKENWVTPQGPNVNDFESAICQFAMKSKKPTTELFAVGMASGTAAIHIALRLLDIKPGDEIFCSSNTFIASCYPIMYEKAIPVFIDSEPTTWNMCPQSLRKAFEEKARQGKRPKAVVCVDLYGMSSHYNEIKKICAEYHVPIVQDAAEALGSDYFGEACGLQGDYGIYSFNGNKIITTSSGGVLLTRSKAMAEKALFYVTQARDKAPYYLHSDIGYNYRLSNISAGIGLGQMKVLSQRVKQRRQVFDFYQKQLSNTGLEFLPEPKGFFSNRWLSTVTLSHELIQRKNMTALDLVLKLGDLNIEARPIWKPMHTQPLFAKNEYFSVHEKSVCEDVFERGLCLPSCSDMPRETQKKVCDTIRKILA